MNKITQTGLVPPALVVSVKCYYARMKSQRVNVPRIYTVNGPDTMKQYVLVRYVTELGAAMSSILKVRETKDEWTLVEEARDERKHEGTMILRWMDEVEGWRK